MNAINLQDYVRYGMILNNIQHMDAADAVVFEKELAPEIMEDKSVPVYALDNLTETDQL